MEKKQWKDVLHIVSGKNQSAVVNPNGKYPIYGSGGLMGYADDYLCEAGTTIVGRKGTINRPIFVNEPFWNIDTAFGIVPDEGLCHKYLYYFCVHFNFMPLDKSTGRPSLAKSDLLKIEMPVPSLSEQQRIVSRIEELFSSLDNAVETLQKTKEQLSVYRQAVLKEAFEGNLTKNWRYTNHKGNEWKVVSITDVVKPDKNALKAGPFGSSLKKEMYTTSGYKIYGQEQVIAGDEHIGNYFIGEEKYQELISCKIVPNDVLISLVGTVGKVLVLSDNCKAGIINPRLIKVSLDKNKMIPYYFKYYFESGYLRSLYKEKVHGATMDVLNMGMIKELPFSWCPIDEQKQVIMEIESRMTTCDNIEQIVSAALVQAEAMRQSILKEAFEGRL